MTRQSDAVHFGYNHVAMTTYSIPRGCSHVAITTDGTYIGTCSDHVAIATYLLYIFVITMLL